MSLQSLKNNENKSDTFMLIYKVASLNSSKFSNSKTVSRPFNVHIRGNSKVKHNSDLYLF